jgi:hypothetical protein
MATINFSYRSKKEQAYLSAKLRFSINKEPFVSTAKTSIKTSLEVWEWIGILDIKDAQLDEKVLNLRDDVKKLKTHILEAFEAETNKNKPTQKEWLQTTINNINKPENETPTKLVEYLEYYLKSRENEINPPFEKKVNALKGKLIKLDAYAKHNHVIKEVNENFKNLFVKFLTKKEYSKNYIKKQFSILKTEKISRPFFKKGRRRVEVKLGE